MIRYVIKLLCGYVNRRFIYAVHMCRMISCVSFYHTDTLLVHFSSINISQCFHFSLLLYCTELRYQDDRRTVFYVREYSTLTTQLYF